MDGTAVGRKELALDMFMWTVLPSDAQGKGINNIHVDGTAVINIHVDGTAVGRNELASAMYMWTGLRSDARNWRQQYTCGRRTQ